MTPIVEPGDVNPRVRALIVGACAVTTLIAWIGMSALWDLVEWAEVSTWDVSDWATGRSAWMYQNALALAVAAAITLAWLPRFDISRLLRVAVLLPVIQLGAIIVAAKAWLVLDGDLAAKGRLLEAWQDSYRPDVTLPSPIAIAIAFAAMVVIGIAIKRRHGEWKHATVMLSLAFLLLLGLWLPLLCRLSFKSYSTGYGDTIVRSIGEQSFVNVAIAFPAIIAIAFVTIAFQYPRLIAHYRAAIRRTTIGLLCLAALFAVSLPDDAHDLYLQSSYLVMTALVLAVLALLLLTVGSGLGSLIAHRRLGKLVQTTGVIEDDGDGVVAYVEVTSWLRGPRFVMRPFVVSTPEGHIPIGGAHVLSNLSITTTALDVGDVARALAPGDRVVIAGQRTKSDGHPFRVADATDIAYVMSQSAQRYRFSDVALVVWRPAVAYLTIVLAVAMPYLSLLLAP